MKSTLHRCPHCGESAVRVLDSRPVEIAEETIVRRRRICKSCSQKWSTFEISDAAYAAVCDAWEMLQAMFPRVIYPTDDEVQDAPTTTRLMPRQKFPAICLASGNKPLGEMGQRSRTLAPRTATVTQEERGT